MGFEYPKSGYIGADRFRGVWQETLVDNLIWRLSRLKRRAHTCSGEPVGPMKKPEPAYKPLPLLEASAVSLVVAFLSLIVVGLVAKWSPTTLSALLSAVF